MKNCVHYESGLLNKVAIVLSCPGRLEDESIPKQFSQKVETGYGISHGPLLQKIIESLQKGLIKPPISAKSALQTSRLVHALYKSDELQDWVKLKDRPISDRLGKELRNEN